jgi:hypothetical protein
LRIAGIEALRFSVLTKNQCFNFVSCNRSAEFEKGRPILRIQRKDGSYAIARDSDWIVKEQDGSFDVYTEDEFEKFVRKRA